jgi:hypothetical protein
MSRPHFPQSSKQLVVRPIRSSLGGSLKGEAFGDVSFLDGHPQAALEAATRPRIEYPASFYQIPCRRTTFRE